MQTVAEKVIGQIIDKDIRLRHKIRNRSTFEKVMTSIINNFAAPTNLTGIAGYLRNTQGVPIKREILASYIELLVKAKLLYCCDRFDMKSKRSLQGGEKYYLADTGIYFARNVNATMDYGPLLENAVYTYLKSKDYCMSVGQIGKLEVDFIAQSRRRVRLHTGVSVGCGQDCQYLTFFVFVHKPLYTFSVFVQ